MTLPNEDVFPELYMPNIDPIDGSTTPPNDRTQNSSILQEIHPLPQGVEKKTTRRRKVQKSEVLTSTPIKIHKKKNLKNQRQRGKKCIGKKTSSQPH